MIPYKALAKSGAAVRALTLAAALSAGLSGCQLIQAANVFDKQPNKSIAAQGERIPVLPSQDDISPAAALKGQDFSLPQPAPLAEWPLPGGNPEQSVEHVAAAPNLRIAWRQSLGVAGLNRKHFVTAPPVMAEGKVFGMDGQAHVSAHDAVTGRRLWEVDVRPKDRDERRDRDAYGGGVAYAGGKLFVTSGYRLISALDAKTGRTLWTSRTDAPLHGAPNVSEGRIFTVTLDDQLLVFDADKGQQLWNYQAIIEPARILAASSPAISGDTVVTGFASGELIAQRAPNGNDLWSQALSQSNRNNALSEIRDIAGRPVIYRGDVYAASHAGLFSAIDLRTGSPRWSLPLSSQTTPWAAGDVVYVISTTGQLVCVARDSGQIYWVQDLNAAPPVNTLTTRGRRRKQPKAPKKAYWSGPVLASNRLIMVSSNGDLEARDPKTGDLQRTIRLGAPAMQPPIAAGNMLYLVTDKAELIAFR
ncbi:MAG TPA: PQQ-binding-like beta-propeller repeat protein [Caulobacteraceae bacterium]|jgi:outer membrane protein assembly factor BamB